MALMIGDYTMCKEATAEDVAEWLRKQPAATVTKVVGGYSNLLVVEIEKLRENNEVLRKELEALRRCYTETVAKLRKELVERTQELEERHTVYRRETEQRHAEEVARLRENCAECAKRQPADFVSGELYREVLAERSRWRVAARALQAEKAEARNDAWAERRNAVWAAAFARAVAADDDADETRRAVCAKKAADRVARFFDALSPREVD